MEIYYKHDIAIHNTSSAIEVLPHVIKLIKPTTIVDFGCGTGSWLKVAKELGAERIVGIDGIKAPDDLMLINDSEFITQDLSLNFDLNKKFDLALSLEVCEHLNEETSNIFIDNITRHSDIILFSAAIPNQGGQNHLNEQPQVYWQNKFKNVGFFAYDILRSKFWDNDKINWWYRQNIIIYAKVGNHIFSKTPPTQKILTYVHPALLNEKSLYISSIKKRLDATISNPQTFFTLKLLIKSILKKLK